MISRAICTCLAAVLWAAVSFPAHAWFAPDDPGAWILKVPGATWCYRGKHTCRPATGRLYWTPDRWQVRGTSGSAANHGRDVFMVPHIKQPWECHSVSEGVKILCCVFLSEGG